MKKRVKEQRYLEQELVVVYALYRKFQVFR